MSFQKLISIVLAVATFELFGCATPPPTTLLADDFRSFTSEGNVLANLHARGLYFGWTEHVDGAIPNDRRAPHEFVSLSGPFLLDGVEGKLTFTFYNDRLMETRFATRHPDELIGALKKKGLVAPTRDGSGVTISGTRTRLQLTTAPDGESAFTWSDPILEGEWSDWVKRFG